ncbi:hypothetical protein NPIL_564321 [Nephila pilipes]|uniref:Uncharacterized protein n=1 Tax=Nephila pilipes TaxID=299642 RepID=A0A8X6PQY5_NEPPI|nr:hypothetical protein NPIL_564321 [Nephila pilipes]
MKQKKKLVALCICKGHNEKSPEEILHAGAISDDLPLMKHFKGALKKMTRRFVSCKDWSTTEEWGNHPPAESVNDTSCNSLSEIKFT